MEVREFIGVFVGGLIALALVATALNKNSTTAQVAQAFTEGFAQDIRAATFQTGQASYPGIQGG
jgi:hypothetical protein